MNKDIKNQTLEQLLLQHIFQIASDCNDLRSDSILIQLSIRK